MNQNQKKIALIILVAVIVCGTALYFFQIKPSAEFAAQNATETITRDELGIEFQYVAGPDALSLFEPSVSREPLLGSFILMQSPDFVALRNKESEDTPPSISLFIFEYNDNEMPKEVEELSRQEKVLYWAKENQVLTTVTDETVLENAEIDGVKAYRYQNQGLYPQTIYLAMYQGKMYMFVGQYENSSDQMQKYFDDIISTIAFN